MSLNASLIIQLLNNAKFHKWYTEGNWYKFMTGGVGAPSAEMIVAEVNTLFAITTEAIVIYQDHNSGDMRKEKFANPQMAEQWLKKFPLHKAYLIYPDGSIYDRT